MEHKLCINDLFKNCFLKICSIEIVGVEAWMYNIGRGGITVSPFTCQVKSTLNEKKALADPQSNALRSTNHLEELMTT